MKTFFLRGRYVPATSILFITPPTRGSYKAHTWTVTLLGGSIIELDEAAYSLQDLTSLHELIKYFEIHYVLVALPQ